MNIWGDAPTDDFLQAFGGGIGTSGFMFQEDFLLVGNLTTNAKGNLGQWASWADTNAIVDTDPGAEAGILAIGAGSNTGVNISLGSNAGSMRLVSGATGFPYQQKMWFECRVALGSIAASKRDVFIGLMDTGATVNTATAGIWSAADTFQAAIGFLGFTARGGATNATDFSVVFQAGSQTLQRPTNLQTLVTTVTGTAPTAYAAVTNGAPTGFVKLGMVFDPTPANVPLLISSASSGQTVGTLAKPVVTFYVNGQQAAAFLTNTNVQAATFPSTWMGPQIGYRSASATAPLDFYVDWIRCAQLSSF